MLPAMRLPVRVLQALLLAMVAGSAGATATTPQGPGDEQAALTRFLQEPHAGPPRYLLPRAIDEAPVPDPIVVVDTSYFVEELVLMRRGIQLRLEAERRADLRSVLQQAARSPSLAEAEAEPVRAILRVGAALLGARLELSAEEADERDAVRGWASGAVLRSRFAGGGEVPGLTNTGESAVAVTDAAQVLLVESYLLVCARLLPPELRQRLQRAAREAMTDADHAPLVRQVATWHGLEPDPELPMLLRLPVGRGSEPQQWAFQPRGLRVPPLRDFASEARVPTVREACMTVVRALSGPAEQSPLVAPGDEGVWAQKQAAAAAWLYLALPERGEVQNVPAAWQRRRGCRVVIEPRLSVWLALRQAYGRILAEYGPRFVGDRAERLELLDGIVELCRRQEAGEAVDAASGDRLVAALCAGHGLGDGEVTTPRRLQTDLGAAGVIGRYRRGLPSMVPLPVMLDGRRRIAIGLGLPVLVGRGGGEDWQPLPVLVESGSGSAGR